MSDLSSVIRKSIEIADRVSKSLQAPVQHAAFKKYNRSGEPEHERPIARTAALVKKQQMKRATDGSERVSQAKLTFVGPVKVDPRDKITLPDGTSPVIIAVESPIDNQGNELITEVWL